MTEKLEVKEKETVTGVEVRRTDDTVTVTKGNAEIRADSHVFALHDAEGVTIARNFTRETFEGALDKVSRPLKGRFAHVPYTSDDLIKDKRAEVELEDR